MTGRVVQLALVLSLLAGASLRSMSPAGAASGDVLLVELDQASVQVGTGQAFGFRSFVTNRGDQSIEGLIVHLNVVSTDGTVYVDPEDWSSDRTQYLETLEANASHEFSWNVRAVTTGDLILYVAVTTTSGLDPVSASAPLHATVSATRTIDAAGVLPIAIGVPAVLVVCLGLTRRRRHALA